MRHTNANRWATSLPGGDLVHISSVRLQVRRFVQGWMRYPAQNTFVFGQELSQDRELVDRRFTVNVTQAA